MNLDVGGSWVGFDCSSRKLSTIFGFLSLCRAHVFVSSGVVPTSVLSGVTTICADRNDPPVSTILDLLTVVSSSSS